MAIELIQLLVGQVPTDYEHLEYIASLIIALFTIKFIYEMFIHVFNLINNK